MPRQIVSLMAGPKPSGFSLFGGQADYKGGMILKSCQSEFHHAPLMWCFYTSQPDSLSG